MNAPRFSRVWLNLVKVGQALKNRTNWLIWLGIPIALFVSTIILRFGLFPQFPRWHFYMNIAISLVLILYVGLYIRTSKESKKLLGLGLLFQVPIIAFSFMEILDEPPFNCQWADQMALWLNKNPESRWPIGGVDGLATAYVFMLGLRIANVGITDVLKQKELHSLVTMTSFLTAIVALATFSAQAPYEVGYAIRAALLFSGLLVGVLCISLGAIIGRAKNPILPYLGAVAMFALGIILGVGVVPFAGGGGIIYMAQIAFWPNLLLLTGVIAVLISDSKCYLYIITQKILDVARQ